MPGKDIQAKIKKGLAKVTEKLGSGELIYLVKATVSTGNPLSPGAVSSENVLLKDAVLRVIKVNQFSNSSAIDGDKELVIGCDVIVKVGDVVTQGASKMAIKTVNYIKPSGVLLAQKCIVREQ